MTRRRTALVALALLAGIATSSTGPLASAAPPSENLASAGSTGDAWSQTKSIQRTVVDADGSSRGYPFGDAFRVTVTADHTQNLRGRERVRIAWQGAQPSAGRAGNPYGASGLTQEYPVVVLQCRGTGTAVTPETCWTSSYAQRSQVSRSEVEATWTRDVHADPADRERLSSSAPMPSAEECPGIDRSGLYSTHLTPFVTAKGKVYSACDKDHMPPEAAADAAFPPAEVAAFTDADGRGQVQFEVRSDVENESLGCNHETACSIVVIPISGISCDRASTPVENDLTTVEKACRKTGQFAPGASNFAGLAVDQAVSPALWWSESNWRNRFVIPITFGLPPDACDILDKRPPTGFYGSELLAQAALQWAPAYCLDEKRFKFQLNQMPDEAGFNLMATGEGAAAEVSSAHEGASDPVGYAPTAVTGFSIGYVIDKPGNQGEYTRLRLNARLVAKLLTQSYPGSGLGSQHPGMSQNPWAIMADPEFVELNPGLSRTTQEAGAALMSLSNSSDVIRQLTDWIAHDDKAMAFIDGKPDPWGMRVNPSYRRIELPRAEWPLLDTYVPQTGSECWTQNPSSYFSLLAAPVTTLAKISSALIDGWPNTQTRCDTDASTNPHTYKTGRVDRQPYGARFLLGVVSLGDAARYGLRSAALETRPGTYVAPSNASLSAAVRLSEQQDGLGPFVLDQADVRRSRTAYPGTMVVYTAARLQNVDRDTAAQVAQFMRVSTTEGQRPGSGNGQLPDGYLPIRRTGVTADLHASAQEVAAAVAAQRAAPEATPSEGAGAGGQPAGAGDGGSDGGVTPPEAAPSGSDPSAAAGAASSSPAPEAAEMPPTTAVGSGLAGGVLPLLILIGAIGCVATAAIRAGLPLLRGRR